MWAVPTNDDDLAVASPEPSPRATEPRATYRLQLSPDFGFSEVREWLDYFAELGISHLYLSPIMQSRSGSSHGYDVVDPTTVSTALGGAEGLRALAHAADQRGLGLIVDTVPNHLAASAENPWWEQLLTEGMSSPSGSVFDINWRPGLPTAEGKVILPVLGAPYGQVLFGGELSLVREDGVYRVRYGDRTFPLRPQSRAQLDDGVRAYQGATGVPDSWESLHELLEDQHYRLVHWRIGDEVINYRRFFTIDDLAAVRVEVPEVFERMHATIIELVVEGVVDGLRVDHPDGLRDPERYFQQIRNRTGAWIVAEKILHPGEQLPTSWSVAGTTGYDFCVDVLGLAVDPDGLDDLRDVDGRLGGGEPYETHAVGGKADVLRAGLAADLERVTWRLWSVAQLRPQARDVTRDWCRRVVARTLEHFDVYRTYVDPETGAASDADRRRIAEAVARARASDDAPPDELWDFFESVLCGDAGTNEAVLAVAARFQQLCSAVMAKGTEDSAFYRYRPLLAANEVGADPADPVRTVEQFQQANAWRAERLPTSMLATATHDTKRGEDTRLRMAALTEVPDLWRAMVDACEEQADDALPAQSRQLVYQTAVGLWPLEGDPHDGHRERLAQYVVKAEREAGLHTSWTDPNEAFEARLQQFARTVCSADDAPEALRRLIRHTSEIAMVTGLAQVVLRCLSPGVPDCYQGTELWDDSLVDPDNRRPVAFDKRMEGLKEIDARSVDDLLVERRSGLIKLAVLHGALRARAAHPACVGIGSGYLPLRSTGSHADHLVPFARVASDGSDAVLVVVPYLPRTVMGDALQPPVGDAWHDTQLQIPGFLQGEYRDVFTGASGDVGDTFDVADVLRTLPVAVLERQ